MKFENLKREHIEQASNKIDELGIPKDHVWSQYYIEVNGKEYPFRYILKLAFSLISNEPFTAQSNEYYRAYVENQLGFPLKYYEGGYNFFTKDELDFFQSIAKRDYRKDNEHQKHYNQKLYPIIEKANYWAKQVQTPEYKLKRAGNWLTGYASRISPYFWPRIYKGEDEDLFFNVEVNAEHGFLGYKLHWYFETKKGLSERKLNMLEDYKSVMGWTWPKISFDKLHEYSWEKLIKETRDYITKFEPHYDHLKKALTKGEKIARITWNTNNWIRPSGWQGKSKSDSYERDNGFGHEEWLFDGSKIINGYKYGFLEPVHRGRNKHIGSMFDLSLFTRNAETRKDYWVTTLNDVEVISIEEALSIQEKYEKLGWFDEMKRDLEDLNLSSKTLEKWIKKDRSALFNIKFKASELSKLNTDLIQIENTNEIPSHRYVLMDADSTIVDKYIEKNELSFDFENTGSEEAELSTRGKRKGSAREIELEYKHNILQESFLKYLQSKYGKSNVKRECRAYGGSKIDITRKTEEGYILYEIKTFNSLTTSIREALGQLLEYCFFPRSKNAIELVIVSHVEPSSKARDYLIHLKPFLNIPLSYIHFDPEIEEIVSII